MPNDELAHFAWTHLGVYLDPSWARSKMLDRLLSLAAEVVEY